MKGLISFAIVCFLVGVQASAIYRNDFEHESNSKGGEQLLPLEESDVGVDVSDQISSKKDVDDISKALDVLEVALKMETIDDLLRFHQNFKNLLNLNCSGNTCQMCYTFICLKITYLEERKVLLICAVYESTPIYCKTLPAQGFKFCSRVPFIHMTACVAIMNMRISNGRACIDLQLSAGRFIYTFNNLCMGTFYLEKWT